MKMDEKLYREIVLTALENATREDGSMYYAVPYIDLCASALAPERLGEPRGTGISPAKTKLVLEQMFEEGIIFRTKIHHGQRGSKRTPIAGYLAKLDKQ